MQSYAVDLHVHHKPICVCSIYVQHRSTDFFQHRLAVHSFLKLELLDTSQVVKFRETSVLEGCVSNVAQCRWHFWHWKNMGKNRKWHLSHQAEGRAKFEMMSQAQMGVEIWVKFKVYWPTVYKWFCHGSSGANHHLAKRLPLALFLHFRAFPALLFTLL